jgi:hypothetical protein
MVGIGLPATPFRTPPARSSLWDRDTVVPRILHFNRAGYELWLLSIFFLLSQATIHVFMALRPPENISETSRYCPRFRPISVCMRGLRLCDGSVRTIDRRCVGVPVP